MNTAGVVNHRQRPVEGGDHLRQPTGFESGRHQDKIGSTIGLVLQLFAEIAHSHSLMQIVKRDDITKYPLIFAIGHKHDLQVITPIG